MVIKIIAWICIGIYILATSIYIIMNHNRTKSNSHIDENFYTKSEVTLHKNDVDNSRYITIPALIGEKFCIVDTTGDIFTDICTGYDIDENFCIIKGKRTKYKLSPREFYACATYNEAIRVANTMLYLNN